MRFDVALYFVTKYLSQPFLRAIAAHPNIRQIQKKEQSICFVSFVLSQLFFVVVISLLLRYVLFCWVWQKVLRLQL